MLKKILFVLTALLVFSNLGASDLVDLEWVKLHLIQVGWASIASAGYETNNGYYYVTGINFEYGSAVSGRILVIKYDTLGNMYWLKTVDTGDFQNAGRQINQTADGNIIVAANDDNGAPNTGMQTTLIKLNAQDGSVIWLKNYEDTIATSPTCLVKDLLVDKEDSSITMISRVSGQHNGNYRTWTLIRKVDKNGNTLWEHYYYRLSINHGYAVPSFQQIKKIGSEYMVLSNDYLSTWGSQGMSACVPALYFFDPQTGDIIGTPKRYMDLYEMNRSASTRYWYVFDSGEEIVIVGGVGVYQTSGSKRFILKIKNYETEWGRLYPLYTDDDTTAIVIKKIWKVDDGYAVLSTLDSFRSKYYVLKIDESGNPRYEQDKLIIDDKPPQLVLQRSKSYSKGKLFPCDLGSTDFDSSGVAKLHLFLNIVNLSQPEDNQAFNKSTINLAWSNNPENPEYNLQIASDSTFDNLVIDTTLTDVNYTANLLDGIYYWHVSGQKDGFYPSGYQSAFKFIVDCQAPVINLVNPANQDTIITNDKIDFRWESKGDITSPESYIFEIDTTENFSQPKIVETDSSQISLLLKPENYFWRVRGYDTAGNQGEFSKTARLTIIEKLPATKIKIWPSPSKDPINLKSGSKLKIKFFDITGRKVKEINLRANIEVEIVFKANGIYFWQTKKKRGKIIILK